MVAAGAGAGAAAWGAGAAAACGVGAGWTTRICGRASNTIGAGAGTDGAGAAVGEVGAVGAVGAGVAVEDGGTVEGGGVKVVAGGSTGTAAVAADTTAGSVVADPAFAIPIVAMSPNMVETPSPAATTLAPCAA